MILTFDTSTSVCSAALHQEGQLLASSQLHLQRAHAASLTRMVQHILDLANVQMADLQAIAVGKGPGSYTGLRIGASTAKGMAFALDIPLLAVSTLKTMACQAVHNFPAEDVANRLFCPMIDARRMEVYTAIYDHNLNEIAPVQALVVDEQALVAETQGKPIIIFGDGAAKCLDVLNLSQVSFLDKVHPLAEIAGLLAWEQYQNKAFENIVDFEPFYLKEFIAGKPTKNKPLV